MSFIGDGVDVICEREGDDVGLQAVDDGAGLGAGAPVGLFDFNGLPGFRLPVRGEGLVEFLVKFAGGVVGDVQEVEGWIALLLRCGATLEDATETIASRTAGYKVFI